MLVDFTNCKEELCSYGGSEKKKKIIYNNQEYLLKFPDPVREENMVLSYINNVYSEYLGCKIFESIGIPVQEVILGRYIEKDGKNKIVVACKDFTTQNKQLLLFKAISNGETTIDRHIRRDIEDVYHIIEELPISNKQEIIESFWNIFVVDTLIGNPDRHLENWGLLKDNNEYHMSPVYDCGSSLNPLLSEEKLKIIQESNQEFMNNAFNIHPVYKLHGKSLTYKEFYQENINDLKISLKNIFPKIDLEKINSIIDSVNEISDLRKDYLKKSIEYRYKNILLSAYKKL